MGNVVQVELLAWLGNDAKVTLLDWISVTIEFQGPIKKSQNVIKLHIMNLWSIIELEGLT